MTNFPLGDMPLSGPPWLFLLLLLVIFFLHLVSMWFLVGGLLVGLTEVIKNKTNWKESKSIRYLPIVMALVMNLGVPPLLFLQVLYPPFFFSSSIIIAAPWLGVFFMLMTSYGLIYAARYGAQRQWQAILFLSISAVVALGISFFFSNNMSLMIKPELWQQLYSYKQNGLNLYPNLPEVVSRWSWILSTSFIAGAALLNRSKYWAIPSALISIFGLLSYKGFLAPEILNFQLVNIGMGFDFVLAALLVLLVVVPIKDNKLQRRLFFLWLALKGLSVVAIRHGIRTASLDPVYSLDKLPLQVQPYLLTIFLLSVVIGLGAVVWMHINGRKGLAV